MPLLMPFYFDYDLLLISVSAVFYAGGRVGETAEGKGSRGIDRWIVAAPGLDFLCGWFLIPVLRG